MQPWSRAIRAAHCQRLARRAARPSASGTNVSPFFTPKMTAQAAAQVSRSKAGRADRLAVVEGGAEPVGQGVDVDQHRQPAGPQRAGVRGGGGDQVGQGVGAGLGGGAGVPRDAAVGERGQDLAQPTAFQGVQPAVDAVHPAQGFGQADATFGALDGVVGVGGLRVALPDQQGQDPAQLDRFHPGSQVHQGGFDLVEPGDPGGGVAQRLHMQRAQPPVPERRSHMRTRAQRPGGAHDPAAGRRVAAGGGRHQHPGAAGPQAARQVHRVGGAGQRHQVGVQPVT